MTDNTEKVIEFPADAVTVDDVREKVRAIIEAEGISQSAAAKEAGVSTSAFSEFMGGTYKGNKDKVARELLRWVNARVQSEQMRQLLPGVPAFIETPTAKKILGALTYAQAFGDIAVIYGGAGMSKTTSIRRYRDKNPNVFLATVTPATAGVAVMLQEIALSMGLRDFPLHPAKLQAAIIRGLTGSRGLLVIDEAQHLTKQALESARSLHDATGVGLALSGNASVYSQLLGKNDNGFAQLYSRVGRRVALTKAMRGDVLAIAGVYGVRDKKSLEFCEDIARRPGALRMLVKVLRLASMGAGEATVGTDHMSSAWAELQGHEKTDGGDYV